MRILSFVDIIAPATTYYLSIPWRWWYVFNNERLTLFYLIPASSESVQTTIDSMLDTNLQSRRLTIFTAASVNKPHFHLSHHHQSLKSPVGMMGEKKERHIIKTVKSRLRCMMLSRDKHLLLFLFTSSHTHTNYACTLRPSPSLWFKSRELFLLLWASSITNTKSLIFGSSYLLHYFGLAIDLVAPESLSFQTGPPPGWGGRIMPLDKAEL